MFTFVSNLTEVRILILLADVKSPVLPVLYESSMFSNCICFLSGRLTRESLLN